MNINITRRDVVWGFLAQVLTMGVGVLILPFLLKMLDSAEVGVWYIFQSFMYLSNVLDFGFQFVFIRNVSYLYGGATNLLKTGFVEVEQKEPNYYLLKVLIRDMRYFYMAITIIFLLILFFVGIFYIRYILQKAELHHSMIWSWWIYAFTLAFNLYFSYYTCLLQGRGFVKYSNWAIIISKMSFAIITLVLLVFDYGLYALIVGYFISCIINRYLFVYYNRKGDFDQKIQKEIIQPGMSLFKIISHNAYKQGIGSIGYFIKTQGLLLIGSYFLSIQDMASYGITIQLLGVINTIASLYFKTYSSQFAQLCILGDKSSIKALFAKCEFIFIVVFFTLGILFVIIGNPLLKLIGSQTLLLSFPLLVFMVFSEFIEANYVFASNFIAINNKVPFYKSSLITSLFVVIIAVVLVKYLDWGCWGLVFAQFITVIFYNGWKWPFEASKILHDNYCNLFYEGYTYFVNRAKKYLLNS